MRYWAKITTVTAVLFVMNTPYAESTLILPAPEETDFFSLEHQHTHKVANFDYSTINTVLWPLVNKYTAYPNVPEWYANHHPRLPAPANEPSKSYILTLRDAIWLALRNNPAVKNAEMQRTIDKFSLELAQWQLEPHFTDTYSAARNVNGGGWGSAPALGLGSTWTNQLGTQTQFNYTNTVGGGSQSNGYSLSVTQPLLNGLLIPELNYLNSVAANETAKLTFKITIMQQLQAVIQSYMSLVQAYNDYDLQKKELEQTKKQLDQETLQVKVGKLARSELLREKINYAQYQLGVLSDKNAVDNSYQSFLQQLGFLATTNIQIDRSIDTSGFEVPAKDKCITIALENNPQYQSDKISVQVAERNLKESQNALWPTLNAVYTDSNTYTGSTSNSSATTSPGQTIGFSVSVPIDPRQERFNLLSAKVALEQAKIALEQEKQTVIQTTIQNWNTVDTDIKTIILSKQQLEMQEQTLKDTYLQLQYGRTTMFEYVSTQQTLLSQQLSYVNSEITYINDVTTLDQGMGVTLQRWNVKLRY